MYVAIHSRQCSPRYLDDELKLQNDPRKAALFPSVEAAVRAITSQERSGAFSLFDFSIVDHSEVSETFVPEKQWGR